jgi:hypothetical protein
MPPPRISTAEVAASIGCAPTTVTRRARELGLGKLVFGRLGFTPGEVEKLRGVVQDGPGRRHGSKNKPKGEK